MKLVRATPLLEHARQENLSVKERLELFIRVCEAINYAHQREVIHRDLKPANILVVAEAAASAPGDRSFASPQASSLKTQASPKVLDFGLARITDADVNITTAGIDSGR